VLIADAPTAPDIKNAGSQFSRYLQGHGVEAPEATRIGGLLDDFVGKQLPELGVLSTVRELREQLRAEKVVAKQIYPGRRLEPDSIGFLMQHYGDDIRAGLLRPGRLKNIDGNLYFGVRDQLKQMTPPLSIADFFEGVAAEGKHGTVGARRIRALSTMLGATELDTARFLSAVRPDRLPPRVRKNPAR
jgi:hypothetical protein